MVDDSPEDSDDGDNSDEELDMRKLVTQQNKTKKKKSGGFQSMGKCNCFNYQPQLVYLFVNSPYTIHTNEVAW